MEINDDRFEERMKQIMGLLEKLLKLMKATNRLNGENLLDSQDLCLLLHISKRSLQRYRSSGQLPFFRIGGKSFYYESDVMKYIQNQIDNKKNREGNDADKNL